MPLKKMTLADAWATSLKFPDSFSRHLFRYLSVREGVRFDVYKDSKGLDTVGVGHRVYANDKMPFGTLVSRDYILSTFKADMKNERSRDVAATVEKFGMGAKIALASFCWTHGPGQFINSYTHRLIVSGGSEAVVQNWVAQNWDKNSLVNRERNKMDLQLIYPRTAQGITYFASYGSSGTFVYVPAMDESFLSLNDALNAAKKVVGLRPLAPVDLQADKTGGLSRFR